MKTGIIVLGKNSASAGEQKVVAKCCRYLTEHGYRNVYPAFHFGEPRSDRVLKRMFLKEGIDTFCVLPMAVAEGNLTIWNMPKRIGLPDNSGSWTMIGKHDVAIRFATALGYSGYLASAIADRLEAPSDDTGVIVFAHGSKLSLSEKTAGRYASYLSDCGWKVSCAFSETGPVTLAEAAEKLSSDGCARLLILPFFLSPGGKSYRDAIEELDATGKEYVLTPPISEYREFLEITEHKVPEDW